MSCFAWFCRGRAHILAYQPVMLSASPWLPCSPFLRCETRGLSCIAAMVICNGSCPAALS